MVSRRINVSVLGVLERPALAWMARRLPPWVTPDQLTAIGFVGALVCAAGYIGSRWSIQYLWLTCLGLVFHWAGDSLDGTLARLRHIERPRYGFFIDHTSDLFSQTVVFLSMGLSVCARFDVSCLGLISFFGAFIYSMIHAHVHDTMRITYFGFGPTEIRALMLLGAIATIFFGVIDVSHWVALPAFLQPFTVYDVVICFLAFGGIAFIAVLALKEGRRLSSEDPVRATKRK